MDSLITAAARALALGDPLGALKRVALREDAAALALRGIAMAQLGDWSRAKQLMRKAARAFGQNEAVARARCVVAEAEIALASRDLAWPEKSLEAARAVLEAHADWVNESHARQLAIRRLLLIGRLDEAEALLQAVQHRRLSPASRAAQELIVFGIAVRRVRAKKARLALGRAVQAARAAGIPALIAEVNNAARLLNEPAAQLIENGERREQSLDQIETLLRSKAFIVDACRYVVRDGHSSIVLARRPVLFALACMLAEAWPNDVSRGALIANVFRTKHANESHRARLRVEIGRLRSAIKSMAAVVATRQGFALLPKTNKVAVLVSPMEDDNASVLALIADGESWSSSGIALALGLSQRNVQRALEALVSAGKIQALGQGRARRWIAAPLPGFATALLLPSSLPSE